MHQYSEVCIGYSVGSDGGGTMHSGSCTLMQELCPGLPGFLEWAGGVFFFFFLQKVVMADTDMFHCCC